MNLLTTKCIFADVARRDCAYREMTEEEVAQLIIHLIDFWSVGDWEPSGFWTYTWQRKNIVARYRILELPGITEVRVHRILPAEGAETIPDGMKHKAKDLAWDTVKEIVKSTITGGTA